MTFDARRAVRLLSALLAIGTLACKTSPVGSGDGGTLWFTSDSGPDASAPDSGSWPDAGGQPTIALAIDPGPHCVLTAVATVTWSGHVTQIFVTDQTDGGTMAQTPTFSTADAGSPATVPVLMLKAETSYAFQAVGMDSSGNQVLSNTVDLTTGSLPVFPPGDKQFPDGGPALPVYTVTDGGVATPGYTLIASVSAPGFALFQPNFVQIVDGTGAPVWYYPASPPPQDDFQQQPDGTFTVTEIESNTPVQGISESPATYKQIDVLGNTLHTWQAGNFVDTHADGGMVTIAATDPHDFRLLPTGDALLFAYVKIPDTNFSGLTQNGMPGLSSVNAVGSALERVQPDGGIAFAWNAADFTEPDDLDLSCGSTINGSPPAVDYIHANAVDIMDDGKYLVSLRNLSETYKIDPTTGDVIWVLGGKQGQFTFVNDPLNGPSCQHGVRELRPESSGCVMTCENGSPSCPNLCGNITMFDDGDGHAVPQSRAVEYAVDPSKMTATLVWSATQSGPPLYSDILGYVQRLPNGNTLIDYGQNKTIDEVQPDGGIVWQMTGNSTFDNQAVFGWYRAYRLQSLYKYDQ